MKRRFDKNPEISVTCLKDFFLAFLRFFFLNLIVTICMLTKIYGIALVFENLSRFVRRRWILVGGLRSTAELEADKIIDNGKKINKYHQKCFFIKENFKIFRTKLVRTSLILMNIIIK